MSSSLHFMPEATRVFSTNFLLRNKGCLGSSMANTSLKRSMHCANVIKCELRDNAFYLRRCVELARKAIGHTSPNPMVGCVIVKDGEIVGEGFHPKAGQPHAEVFALRDAGDLAENATAYVSLEPCNHYGRTPPCTEALIGAKVKQVVVGMVDPNPIVASKGVEKLRQAGIDVVVGVEEMLCRKLNEAYIHKMITGKPFVSLRYSISVNGKPLNQLGNGAGEAGGFYSQLLQEYDGVVISSDLLTREMRLPCSEEIGANQPVIIIIAKGSSSPFYLSSVTRESAGKIIVLADNNIELVSENEGIEVVVLQQVTLDSVLDFCGRQGLCSIMLDYRYDSGVLGNLVEDGLKENMIQKVITEVSPVLIGGEEGRLNFGSISLRLKNLESRISNESVLIEGYLSSSL